MLSNDKGTKEQKERLKSPWKASRAGRPANIVSLKNNTTGLVPTYKNRIDY